MNKKKVIIIAIILVIVITLITVLLINNNKKEDVSIKTIKHDVVDKLYNNLDKKENTNEKEYVSKLYGYTSDNNGNLKMTVKEGYIQNNKVYDLDGKELGNYTKDTLNTLLDKGTTKTYDYTYEEGKYNLK